MQRAGGRPRDRARDAAHPDLLTGVDHRRVSDRALSGRGPRDAVVDIDIDIDIDELVLLLPGAGSG